jgi:hypothetical protein
LLSFFQLQKIFFHFQASPSTRRWVFLFKLFVSHSRSLPVVSRESRLLKLPRFMNRCRKFLFKCDRVRDWILNIEIM